MSLSPVCGILNTELIDAAGPRFGLSQVRAFTPLGTEDRKPVPPLEKLRSVPGFSRLTGLARKGRPRCPAGNTHEVDVTSPSLCVVTAPALRSTP